MYVYDIFGVLLLVLGQHAHHIFQGDCLENELATCDESQRRKIDGNKVA